MKITLLSLLIPKCEIKHNKADEIFFRAQSKLHTSFITGTKLLNAGVLSSLLPLKGCFPLWINGSWRTRKTRRRGGERGRCQGCRYCSVARWQQQRSASLISSRQTKSVHVSLVHHLRAEPKVETGRFPLGKCAAPR